MDEAALGKLSAIVEQLKLELRNEGKTDEPPTVGRRTQSSGFCGLMSGKAWAMKFDKDDPHSFVTLFQYDAGLFMKPWFSNVCSFLVLAFSSVLSVDPVFSFLHVCINLHSGARLLKQKYDGLCDLTAFEEFTSTLPSHLAT